MRNKYHNEKARHRGVSELTNQNIGKPLHTRQSTSPPRAPLICVENFEGQFRKPAHFVMLIVKSVDVPELIVRPCCEWVCISFLTPCNEVFGPLRIHLVCSCLSIYVITIPCHSIHMAKPVLGTYPNQFQPVNTVQISFSKIHLYIIFLTVFKFNRSLSKISIQRNIQAM